MLGWLKNYQNSGKRPTTAIYIEVAPKVETSKATMCQASISGTLKYLGVSKPGYRTFTKHKPSAAQQRKAHVKQNIHKICFRSRQNCGACKNTFELRNTVETIPKRTAGKYMREMGIRAKWTRPWIATT